MSSILFRKMSRAANSDEGISTFSFHQAAEWEDVEGAFRILHDSYLRRGLIPPTESGLRYTHFSLLPETGTFVAKDGDRVVGTLSAIVGDHTLGLPMGELYAGELDTLRKSGHRLAEGSGLAVDPDYRAVGMYVVMNLVKMAITYARKMDATCAVIACHPKHARFYEDVFLFQQFGPPRTYQAINDAPAVAHHLDIQTLEATYRAASSSDGYGIYRYFFTDEIFRCPEVALRAGALSRDTVRRLCTLQPAVARSLETRAPQLFREVTGWDDRSEERQPLYGTPTPAWEDVPIFVAA